LTITTTIDVDAAEVLPRGERLHERWNLYRMFRRPHRMRLRIVADINSARAEQSERLAQQGVLAGSSVGEDEVEGIRRFASYDRCSVLAKHCQPWVGSQMRSGDGLHLGIDIDREQPGGGVHAVE
jgi:hypothetical protein